MHAFFILTSFQFVSCDVPKKALAGLFSPGRSPLGPYIPGRRQEAVYLDHFRAQYKCFRFQNPLKKAGELGVYEKFKSETPQKAEKTVSS